MTHHIARLLAGSALLAATFAANAAIFEASGGQPVSSSDIRGASGSANFTLSKSTLTALNAAGAEITGLNYTILDTTQNRRLAYTSATATLPMQSLWIESPGNYRSIQLMGGLQITTISDGLAVNPGGGALSIANIRLDLTSGVAYADVKGATGVGSQQGVAMWSFSPLIKPSDAWREGTMPLGATGNLGTSTYIRPIEGNWADIFTINDLRLTEKGTQLLTQGLNLSYYVGVPAVKSIADFGSITTSITANYATLVPEASTTSMMLLGLAGMAGAVAAKRRRAVAAA
jgi:hypothetical protein